MRLSENWKDYELIDASDGERLERWGNIILIRPDPQIIWSTEKKIRFGIRLTHAITAATKVEAAGSNTKNPRTMEYKLRQSYI